MTVIMITQPQYDAATNAIARFALDLAQQKIPDYYKAEVEVYIQEYAAPIAKMAIDTAVATPSGLPPVVPVPEPVPEPPKT